jgi:glycine cleavage system H protein
MSEIPKDLLYTPEHEYLKKTSEDGVYQVGITSYAQGELGDVVYVELPAQGATFDRMQPFGTIEAVKAVSDLYSPAAGKVIEVNKALANDPELVNNDPYGEGWMIKLQVTDKAALASLLDAAGYAKLIGGK